MLSVSRLFIYPVKSLGGIDVKEARLTDRGLEYDRRWMLIDENNRFLSQRTRAQMALFKLTHAGEGFSITYLPDGSAQFIAYRPLLGPEIAVSIWDDECTACLISEDLDQWFSEKLDISCRLVYMPDESLRPVSERYARKGEMVSFADAYPILLLGQSSLDFLNHKLAEEVQVNRFRPNIVFTGAEAHFEDRMAHFTINHIDFFGVKPCARCKVVGIDQQTAQTYVEPMKTLARYRSKNYEVFFGQNLIYEGKGKISVGDHIDVLGLKPDFMLQPNKVTFYDVVWAKAKSIFSRTILQK
jgi:uncharacterized protein